MRVDFLAEQLRQDPVVADAAFLKVNAALELVLPSSNAHERYHPDKKLGLAAVIAEDFVGPDSYNPLHPLSPDLVCFMIDNRPEDDEDVPEAWLPQAIDPELLGGPMPEGMGRFTAFALAKINTLTTNALTISSWGDKVNIKPGSVGFAGGQKLFESLIAVSGLWEVHDHIVVPVLAEEIARTISPDENAPNRSIDELAAQFEQVFGAIKLIHTGKEASELTRDELPELLIAANAMLSRIHYQNYQAA